MALNILPRKCVVACLLVISTVITLVACAIFDNKTETHYRISVISRIPNLSAGLIHQTTNGVVKVSYVFNYRDTWQTLDAETEPVEWIKECHKQAPGYECAGQTLLWGYVLRQVQEYIGAEEEVRALGLRFAIAGYQQLTSDLQPVSYAQPRGDTWRTHIHYLPAAFPKPDYSKDKSRELLLAQLGYALTLWSELPLEKDDADVFTVAHTTVESMKDLLDQLLDDQAPPLPSNYVEPILSFWNSAFEFHQRPAPSSFNNSRWNSAFEFHQHPAPSSFNNSTWNSAFEFHQRPAPSSFKDSRAIMTLLLNDGIKISGIGYSRWPGDPRLQPLSVLARTDLAYSESALAWFRAWRLIDHETDQKLNAELVRKSRALRESELLVSLGRVELERDLERVHALQRDISLFYHRAGRLADAERILTETLAYLRSTGQQGEWAISMIDLASYRFIAKDWNAVLRLIAEIRPVLYSGLGYDLELELEEFRRVYSLEKQAKEKLGQIAVEDKIMIMTAKSYSDLIAELDSIKAIIDPELRIKRLNKLRDDVSLSEYERLMVSYPLFNLLAEQRQLDQAEDLAIHMRPVVASLLGRERESQLLGELLEVQRLRGNIGRFDETVAEYQRLRTSIAGANWRGNKAPLLAEVAFLLRDYQNAEDHLMWKLKYDYTKRLEDLNLEVLDAEFDNPIDKLLLARVYFEQGKREETKKILADLDAVSQIIIAKGSVRDAAARSASLKIAYGLAEFDIAHGNMDHAHERLKMLLERIEPLEDINMWTKAAIMFVQNGLRHGWNIESLVRRLDELIPHLLDFRDLNTQAGIDMDLSLADYYRANKRFLPALQHADRALRTAKDIGSFDQEIIAHRIIGELRSANGDLHGAIEAYRQSAALLQQVSHEIFSDISKIGYRVERTKVFPMLVESLHQRFLETGDKKLLDQIVEAVEQGKSQALSEIFFSQGALQTPFSLALTRNSLDKETAVISFYLAEGRDTKLYRTILDAHGVRFDELNLSPQQLEQRVRTMVDQLANLHLYDYQKYRIEAASLASELFPQEWLTFAEIPYRRLFIIPTGVLHLLPFSALIDKKGHFLDEESVLIAYLPNLTSLKLPPPVKPSGNRAAAIINPSLDFVHQDTLNSNTQLRERFDTAFKNWSKGSVRWEKRWTRDDFKKEAPALDNVFLFSHARFLPSEPLNSYVRVAQNGAEESVRLTAREIMRSRVGGGLWVLAACSTGVGSVRPGDEVLGLPRALLQAGARAALISLWDIDADISLELMAHFYEYLSEGEGTSIAAALKSATSHLREQGKLPYEWGPFILVGHHEFR